MLPMVSVRIPLVFPVHVTGLGGLLAALAVVAVFAIGHRGRRR